MNIDEVKESIYFKFIDIRKIFFANNNVMLLPVFDSSVKKTRSFGPFTFFTTSETSSHTPTLFLAVHGVDSFLISDPTNICTYNIIDIYPENDHLRFDTNLDCNIQIWPFDAHVDLVNIDSIEELVSPQNVTVEILDQAIQHIHSFIQEKGDNICTYTFENDFLRIRTATNAANISEIHIQINMGNAKYPTWWWFSKETTLFERTKRYFDVNSIFTEHALSILDTLKNEGVRIKEDQGELSLVLGSNWGEYILNKKRSGNSELIKASRGIVGSNNFHSLTFEELLEGDMSKYAYDTFDAKLNSKTYRRRPLSYRFNA